MKNTSKKFWLILLFSIVCVVTLISTSVVPIFSALQSKAKRLYPYNTTDLVNINEIFVYELPAESKGFPFGLSCSSLSPVLLERNQSPILATTMHYNRIVGIMPDPMNKVLLRPNSKVLIRITGKCSIPFRLLHSEINLFEYPIDQETFQVKEARHSQDKLNQLISDYIDDEIPPNAFEQFLVP